MTLVEAPRDGETYADGVRFTMMLAERRTTTILVTRQTLHDVEDRPFVPFDELVRFRAHRERFERITRRKHANDEHQPDGCIRIINGDLTDRD